MENTSKKKVILKISITSLIVIVAFFALISFSDSLKEVQAKEISKIGNGDLNNKIRDREYVNGLRNINSFRVQEGNNYFSYNTSKKELIIEEHFKNILRVRLTTSYMNIISVGGPNTKVAEIYLEDFDKTLINNLFDSYELYDVNNGYEKINRVLHFKYGIDYDITECIGEGEEQECFNLTKTNWIEFNSLSTVPKGVKIGIFTDTYLHEKIEWVPTIKGFKVYQWASWEIADAVYDSISLSMQDTYPMGLFFKSDGTKLYEVGQGNDKFYQYTCTTAWDISSCSYDSISLSTQDVTTKDLFFKPDGTKLYEVGSSGNSMYQYSCSDAWNLTSCSYDSISLSTQDGTPTALSFKSDGTKMYELGLDGNKIFQYSCSSAWNLSSCTYDSISISTQTGQPHGLFFKSDGLKMYETGSNTNFISQYVCSDAWNLSSCSNDVNISTQDRYPRGLFFKPDGTKMYEIGGDGVVVYQYTISPDLDVQIVDPKEQVYNYNESLPLNFTIVNATSLDTCWFKVINSTDFIEINNQTLSNCQNSTFNVSGSDTYTLTLYVNDTEGHEDSDVVIFSTSLVAPAVVLDYPANNQFFDTGINIYFNFTSTDSDGLDTCQLWGNWTGTWHNNYTWTNPTNATQNFTIVNITNSVSVWNIKCNDTIGNVGWGLNNRTIGVDTIYPLVEITDPLNDSSANSLALTISYNVSDLNINNCFFTLRDSGGVVHNYVENTSVSCSESGSRAISTLTYGTYTFQLYGKDKAGNENSTTITFTNSAPSSPGGGTALEVLVVDIVAFERVDKLVGSYDLLSLAKIYASFYRECTSRYPNQKCDLNDAFLTQMSNGLSFKVEAYNNLDKKTFYQMYLNGETEVFQVELEIAEKFNLIRNTEGLTLLLEVKPHPLDKWWVKGKPWEEKKDYKEYLVYSNKPMKDCEVVNGNQNLSYYFECELIVNDNGFSNTAIIRLYETDESIFSETYETTIMWTAVEKDQNHFQKVYVRMVNVGYKSPFTLGIPFIYSLIVYLFVIFIAIAIYSVVSDGKKNKWTKFVS